MPQSKDPKRYPPLVRTVAHDIAELKPFTLRFPDKKQAIAFRFSVYGYRAALLADMKEDEDFDEIFAGFRFCTISLDGCMLHFKPATLPDNYAAARAELSKLLVVEEEAAPSGDAQTNHQP